VEVAYEQAPVGFPAGAFATFRWIGAQAPVIKDFLPCEMEGPTAVSA